MIKMELDPTYTCEVLKPDLSLVILTTHIYQHVDIVVMHQAPKWIYKVH